MLHRLIYVAAITGVVHYWWLVKSDIRPPLRYAIIVGILLGARTIRASLRARHVTGPRVPATAPAQKVR
jgi:sulfoxide reductase heme-binding subunit YedZ